ncbi:MAG: N-formylglutamate amidohydrolase [Paracoccaceae bacterium]|jgi:N-formylglutamate amidohydrolase
MTNESYRLLEPTVRSSSVIFASPHSGKAYPSLFLKQTILNQLTIRSSEDAFVDQLFDAAPRFGAPLLLADVPRAYVDLNRSAEELDPALIKDVSGVSNNPRVSSGLGVIPRVVANGRAIYRGKLEAAEAQERILTHWYPYHQTLQNQLAVSQAAFGEAILIDCHSMPHEAVESVSKNPSLRPEVVLGDRFGAACAPDIMDAVEKAFVKVGLRVARNTPFAGAFVTQHYGRPARQQHAIQVEIDRRLYMDEVNIRPNHRFDEFRRLMTQVVADISVIRRKALPLAAE